MNCPLHAMFLLLAFLGPARAEKAPVYPDHDNLLYYLDARGKSVPVKSAADWRRRREHVLAGMQLVMGPLPPASRKVALELKIDGEERLPGVVRKKVSFA